MKCRTLLMGAALVAAASTMAMAQSDVHQPSKKDAQNKAPAGQPPLPPGWTMEDMQACEAAATPGKEHERLTKGAGTWQGKGTMWMGPGMEGTPVECTTVITPMFEGRYVKTEITGDMPGMPGPFNGFGINGFDNVSKKYFSTWIDNCGTGVANGTGVLSEDGKTMTWTYTYNCPIAKKPATMRQIEKSTGEKTMTMEMFGTDPKSGKEFKMISYNFTKK